MKNATFFFRDGGLIITKVQDADTIGSIAKRLCAGGFIVCKDSNYGTEREVAINLADVSTVVLTDN